MINDRKPVDMVMFHARCKCSIEIMCANRNWCTVSSINSRVSQVFYWACKSMRQCFVGG